MSKHDVDDYLAGLDPVARTTLESLRRSILAAVPDADQGLSYGAPAFKVGGKAVAGFAAAKDHLSYLPHSGSVLQVTRGGRRGFRDVEGVSQVRS